MCKRYLKLASLNIVRPYWNLKMWILDNFKRDIYVKAFFEIREEKAVHGALTSSYVCKTWLTMPENKMNIKGKCFKKYLDLH